MRVIILTQGQHTVVSDHVYEWASKFKWRAIKGHRSFYAARAVPNPKGTLPRQTIIYLHRAILGTPKGIFTDHIDGDGLNNLDENLRRCNRSQNGRNSKITARNTSGYRGVSFCGQLRRWKGSIRLNGKATHLGYFDTAVAAAQAYDRRAVELHGEFAQLNFPKAS